MSTPALLCLLSIIDQTQEGDANMIITGRASFAHATRNLVRQAQVTPRVAPRPSLAVPCCCTGGARFRSSMRMQPALDATTTADPARQNISVQQQPLSTSTSTEAASSSSANASALSAQQLLHRQQQQRRTELPRVKVWTFSMLLLLQNFGFRSHCNCSLN